MCFITGSRTATTSAHDTARNTTSRNNRYLVLEYLHRLHITITRRQQSHDHDDFGRRSRALMKMMRTMMSKAMMLDGHGDNDDDAVMFVLCCYFGYDAELPRAPHVISEQATSAAHSRVQCVCWSNWSNQYQRVCDPFE